MDRLVLGSGSVGLSLAERVADRASTDSLVVLADDETRVASLKETGIDARHVDVTDVSAIRTVAGTVDSVVISPDRSERTPEIVEAARRSYPDAFVFACVSAALDDEKRRSVAEHADRLFDATTATTEFLLDRAGDAGLRIRKLLYVLRDIDGTLAVVAHDNPDPDAIASAVGLSQIASTIGTDAVPCYYGEIRHQENRALVNLLEYDLRNLDHETSLEEFGGIALVDHSRPGINDGLPESTPVDIVVDHHPPREPVEARFADLRRGVGATSTLVLGYLHQLGVEVPSQLATGLLYGIRTDTDDFSREVSKADFEAAARLVDRVDSSAIQQIESPSVTGETLDIIGRAIANRHVRDDVLTTCVGRISDRDALSQAADKLLEMEGVSTTLVFGYTETTVYVSARSRGTALDLGEALREAFGQIGSAGGHADMAGAQIPVGILLEETDEAERDGIVEEIITERFFETLGIEQDYAAAVVYADFLGTDESLGFDTEDSME